MANIIKHKRSSVAGQAPTAAQIDVGELAINFADKKLFTKDATNAVIELGGGSKWTTETGGISRSDNVKVGGAGVPASALDVNGTISHAAPVTTGAMNLLIADRFTATVTANTTFSFVNAPASRAAEVVLRITNGGAFAVTWPANVIWPYGVPPVLKTAGTDIILFWTHDGGTSWYARAITVKSVIPDPLGMNWKSAASLGATVDMHHLAVSPTGVFIAASTTTGTVRRSVDLGTTWAAVTTGSTDTWGSYGVAYGNGRFIIGDWGGNGLYSSTDGLAWSVAVTGSRDNYGINYHDGYFTAGSGTAGGNGFAYGSVDGVVWNYGLNGSIGAMAGITAIYVASLNRTFVAGTQYKYVNDIPTSSTPWTGNPTGMAGTASDVAWSPTENIAVLTTASGIYYSSDLISWSLGQTASGMNNVVWYQNQFIAVGNAGKIFTSPDGITWTARTSGTTNDLFGIEGYNNTLVAVGYNGTVLTSS
jgi:hypothetical protein